MHIYNSIFVFVHHVLYIFLDTGQNIDHSWHFGDHIIGTYVLFQLISILYVVVVLIL